MKVNKNQILSFVITAAIAFGATSCSKKSSSKSLTGSSRAIGWEVDKTTYRGSSANKGKNQVAAPGLVFVEGGTFTMGQVQDDMMHDRNNTPTQQHVQSFYIDETEVTNAMYHGYLEWTKEQFPPSDENLRGIYEGALPDTLVWRNRLGYNETMTNNYLRHPAYAEYPVVGVNWIQAVEFCEWRTDRVNEAILEKNGFLKKGTSENINSENTPFNTDSYTVSPSTSMGGNEEIVLKNAGKKQKLKKGETATEEKNVYAQRSSGLILPEYRLPTEAEWEYAAAADVGQREYNTYKGQKKYPWSGSYTRSAKRQNRGDQLANFKQGNGDYGGIAGWSDDGADITNEVKKYPANDFGLYDMAGNVAEWVADVYRPIIDNEANDFNYFRGNQYTKNKIGKDGKVVLTTLEDMKKDTLSNGKIVTRTLPGQIAQVPVDENETYLRQNFDKSDNINYRDGDKQSTKYYDFGGSDDDTQQTKDAKAMYNSPKHKVAKDSAGALIKNYDKSSKRTTLINDQVRVFKGGSWRDRAYWLDPAQRRYLPQDMATDYLGFRCAMSRVGPKTEKRKSPKN